MKALTTSAIALFNFANVTCRFFASEISCAVIPAMCRAASAGPMFDPHANSLCRWFEAVHCPL